MSHLQLIHTQLTFSNSSTFSQVLTDKDFMKTHLFNASELATKISHPGPVQHVLGSPKTDAYGQALGGAVQVQVKPRPLKKTIDHDEVPENMGKTWGKHGETYEKMLGRFSWDNGRCFFCGKTPEKCLQGW
jgi:hypothetical protein